MKEKILEALKGLDTKADASWTQEGLVNLNAFKFVMGGESVTREQLDEVAPGFTRETAPTYFEEKAPETTEQSNAPEVKPEANEGDNVATSAPLTVGVEVTLSDALKTLIKVGQVIDLSELTAEELSKIMENVPDRRNQLITLREEFNAIMEKEFKLLVEIEDEFNRKQPKESHADLVKRIHEANMNSKYIVDQPRQRVAPVVPPLVRK